MNALVEAGLLHNRIPYIRGGSGPRHAAVCFGVNALFKPLHRVSNPARYAAQIARLLPGHRYVILGYAGHSFDEIVRDMETAIPIPPDVLMGISLGGFAALRFAATHPDRVRRLVLLCSAHRFSPNGEQMLARQKEALARGDLHTLVRENALLFRRARYNWLVRAKLWKDGARLAEETRPPADILADYHQLFGPGFSDNAALASRIRCPACIIGGSADQLFGIDEFDETARLIPGALLSLMAKETHMLPAERPAAVAAVIADFLAGNIRVL